MTARVPQRLVRLTHSTAALAAAVVFVAALLIVCGWISDDAFITMRVIDNAVAGHGLRWNIMERVQAYTHPLWLAVLLPFYALSHEVLWTVSLVSVAFDLAAFVFGIRWLATTVGRARALAFLLFLVLSKSVLAFGTSGLENPLSLFLLVAIYVTPPERTRQLGLLTALLLLTRLDLVLIAAPFVGARLLGAPQRRRLEALVLVALPVLAWEIFSLIYYGAFVPNTAFAKLMSGLPRGVLLQQGLRYVASLGIWDPCGALLLLLGIAIGLLGRGRMLAFGLLLYCGYVVWIGGDFMAGRFFMVPIVLATLLLCEAPWPGRAPALLATIPLFIFAGHRPSPTIWLLGYDWPYVQWGIVDERTFYIASTGLFHPLRSHDLRWNPYASHGREIAKKGVVVEGAIGMFGYYGGRGVHIIDDMALADPLLARLPMSDPSEFRPGHFRRAVPEGYEQTLYSGTNRIVDPDLARYWDAIALVTRGPIWSAPRWRAIWALSTGKLDPLRDAYLRRQRLLAEP